ncbi:Iq domain-containing protein g [Plakobranchus ocellatus]|uniref:Iq domain-containing protein g n=1 Tax=Plakobranchus ocellatus TaxID=259542 RepID=A0AAV4C308_9GAST|nr:Iq domain-containing protein g [Plakobranchus ocellatus]
MLTISRFTKNQEEINETKQSKKKELQVLKLLEHQIEDEGQELRMRTEVEAVYTQNIVNSKIQESAKLSERAPQRCLEELRRIGIWLSIETLAHTGMVNYLNTQIERFSALLEYWVTKYEADKERLMTDLEEIKEERAITAATRQRLEEKIRKWMPIIKDERRIRSIREGRESFKNYCSLMVTKIAARWRGYMVRAALGRFGAANK